MTVTISFLTCAHQVAHLAGISGRNQLAGSGGYGRYEWPLPVD